MSQYHWAVFGSALVLPAVACSVIAAFDKRPFLKWFGYGLLAGVFGVIYILFNAPEDKQAGLPARTALLLLFMWALMFVGLLQTKYGYIIHP